MIDMQELNKIIEINQQDMYVIVEAGVTWKKLNDALSHWDYKHHFGEQVQGYLQRLVVVFLKMLSIMSKENMVQCQKASQVSRL